MTYRGTWSSLLFKLAVAVLVLVVAVAAVVMLQGDVLGLTTSLAPSTLSAAVTFPSQFSTTRGNCRLRFPLLDTLSTSTTALPRPYLPHIRGTP